MSPNSLALPLLGLGLAQQGVVLLCGTSSAVCGRLPCEEILYVITGKLRYSTDRRRWRGDADADADADVQVMMISRGGAI